MSRTTKLAVSSLALLALGVVLMFSDCESWGFASVMGAAVLASEIREGD